MPYYEDKPTDPSYAHAKIETALNAKAGLRRNGAPDNPVGRTVFSEQIDSMMQMMQKLHYLTQKVTEVADVVNGPRDEPSLKSGTIASNPQTISQAWAQLCSSVDDLGYQIERLYL